jgi:vitamin B12 transporter
MARPHVLPAVAALLPVASLAAQQPAPADAARDTAALRPVVVTATRLPVPQAATTATATVITGAELRARGVTHVLDALRDVPGAAVLQNGSFGATTSLFLRGGDSKYTQVLVDGVPVNQAGGAFNWANLTVDNVERIEILRGPASVLYGSDAVSGVVQLFTRRGAGRPRAALAARGGSYGSAEGEVDASGALGALGWSAGAAHYASRGILDSADFDNRYRNSSASATLRYAAPGRGDLSVAARAQRARYHFPTNGSGAIVDRNAFREEERGTVGVDGGYFLRRDVEARAQLGAAGLTGRNDDRPDGATRSNGSVSYDGTTRRNADARVNWYMAPGTVVTLGGDYRGTMFRSADSSISAAGTRPGSRTAPRRDNRAVYGQLLAEAGGRLTLTAGGRYDDNSAFGAFRTVRAGAGLRVADGTRLRAAAGNAFREPTLPENFARSAFERGNAALRPERTRSFEAGVEQTLPRGVATVAATYFLQRFRDVIQYGALAPIAGMRDSSNYFNVAEANAGGVELEARLAPVAGVTSSLSYTHVDTRVVDPGLQTSPNAAFVRGSRLLRRPANLASLALTAPLAGRGTLSARVNYTGRRDDIDFRSFRRGVLPSYTLLNLAGEYALLQRSDRPGRVALTLRADNVLGREYEPFYGFRAPGATVLAGLRLDAGR